MARKAIKIFLDSNVLLSGLLSEKGAPRVILDIYQSYFPKLRLEVIHIPPIETLKPYIGIIAAKDAPVLASAVTSDADYLVTGDKKDFDKLKDNAAIPVKVVNPAELVHLIGHIFTSDLAE